MGTWLSYFWSSHCALSSPFSFFMDPDPTSITQVSVSILKSLKNILNNQKYISFGLGKFNILRQISIFNLFLHVKNLKKWERNQDLDLFFCDPDLWHTVLYVPIRPRSQPWFTQYTGTGYILTRYILTDYSICCPFYCGQLEKQEDSFVTSVSTRFRSSLTTGYPRRELGPAQGRLAAPPRTVCAPARRGRAGQTPPVAPHHRLAEAPLSSLRRFRPS